MTMLNSLSSVICVLVASILRGNKFYVAWYFPLLSCWYEKIENRNSDKKKLH